MTSVLDYAVIRGKKRKKTSEAKATNTSVLRYPYISLTQAKLLTPNQYVQEFCKARGLKT